MKIKYKISFTGQPDRKLWDSGWRVNMIWRFWRICLLRYVDRRKQIIN